MDDLFWHVILFSLQAAKHLLLSAITANNTYSKSTKGTLGKVWCEICSKLTIKTLERRQRHYSGISIVNF